MRKHGKGAERETMTAESKMTAARTDLVLTQPFFGALALRLKLQADPTCETAWVDGRTLGYNPAFIESLTHDRTVGLVAHEVEHCALGHPWRRDGRDHKRWNQAADKAINSDLRASGFKLPDGALYAQGDEAGKSAEWIYSRMHEDESGKQGKQGKQGAPSAQGKQGAQGKPQPDATGGAPDPLGELRDAPSAPDADGTPAPTEQEWKQAAAEAMQQAKMQGKMPGGLARAVSDALKGRVDVRSLLLRFFTDRAASDYSWSRPNLRYIAQGLYLPALDSRELGEVAVMVDTSGSIDAESLSYARGILEQVIDECNPSAVTVYYADARVCRVDRFERGEPLVWHPAGGGGTNFCPALEAIGAAESAVCAVCITDLAGRFPTVPPAFPVLWLATTKRIAPFGETVELDR